MILDYRGTRYTSGKIRSLSPRISTTALPLRLLFDKVFNTIKIG